MYSKRKRKAAVVPNEKGPPARKPRSKKPKKQTPTTKYVKVDPAYTRAKPSREVTKTSTAVVADKEQKETELPPDPTYLSDDDFRPADVFCGRNSHRSRQAGNNKFRQYVLANVTRYLGAKTRYLTAKPDPNACTTPKTVIVKEVIDIVESNGGRFLQLDKRLGLWFIMERDRVEKKVAQSFRDCKKLRGDGASMLSLEVEKEATLKVKKSPAEVKERPAVKKRVISRTRSQKKGKKMGRPRKATQDNAEKKPSVEAAEETPDLPAASPNQEAEPNRVSSNIQTADIKPNDVLVCFRPSDSSLDDADDDASSEAMSDGTPDTHWPQPVYSYIVDEYSATFGSLSNTKQLALGSAILQELRQVFEVRFLIFNRPSTNNPVGEAGWRVMADSPARRKILDALLQNQLPPKSPVGQDHLQTDEPCELEKASPRSPSSHKCERDPVSKDCQEIRFRGKPKTYSEEEAAMFAPLLATHDLAEKAALSGAFEASGDVGHGCVGSSSILTPNRTTKMRLVSPEQLTSRGSVSTAPPDGFTPILVEKLKPTDVIVYHRRLDASPSNAVTLPTTPGSQVVAAIIELNYSRHLKRMGSGDMNSLESPSLNEYRRLARAIHTMLDERGAQFYVCVVPEGPSGGTSMAWYKLSPDHTMDWLILQLSMAFEEDRRAIEKRRSSPLAMNDKSVLGSSSLPDVTDFQGVCQWLSPFAEYWNGDPSVRQTDGDDDDDGSPIMGETLLGPLDIPVGKLRHPGYLAFRWILHETYRHGQHLKWEKPLRGEIDEQCDPVKALMALINATGGRFVERVGRAQARYVPHWRALDSARSLEVVSNRFFKTGNYSLHHPYNWDYCVGGLDYRDICGCMTVGWNPHVKCHDELRVESPFLIPHSKNSARISGAVGSQMTHFSPLRSKRSCKVAVEAMPSSASIQVPDLGDTKMETKDFKVIDDDTKELTNMKIYVPEKPGRDWLPPRSGDTSFNKDGCAILVSPPHASAARHTNVKHHHGYCDQHIHVVPQECPDTRTFDSKVGLATVTAPHGNTTDMDGYGIQGNGAGDDLPPMTSFGLFASSSIYNGPELLERMESWGLAAVFESVSANAGSMISRTALNTQTSFSSTAAPRISLTDSDAGVSTDTWDLLRSTSKNLVSPAASKQSAGDPLENMPEPPEFHASETFSQLWDTDPRLKFGKSNSSRSIAILDDTSTESSVQELVDRSRLAVSHAFC